MAFTIVLPDYDNDLRNHPATVWLVERLGPCINEGDPCYRRRYYGEDWTVQQAIPSILYKTDSSIPANVALIYTLSDRVPEKVKFEFALRFK